MQHAINPVSDADPSPTRSLAREATFKELGESNVRPRPLLYDKVYAVMREYKPGPVYERPAK